MSQYALPNGNRSNDDWVEGAGDSDADYFDEFDEGFGSGRGSGSGPDDATTYWSSSNAPVTDNLRMTVSTITDPSVTTGHIMRWCVAKGSDATTKATDGQQIDLDVILINDNDPFDQVHNEQLVDIGLSAGWDNSSYTLSAGEVGNIVNYGQLYFRLEAQKVGGGTKRNAWCSALEFECPDAGTPFTGVATAGTTAVSGATPVPARGQAFQGIAATTSISGATPSPAQGLALTAIAGTVSPEGSIAVWSTNFTGVAIAGTVLPSGAAAVLAAGWAQAAIAGTVTPIGTPDAVLIAAGPFIGVATAGTVGISGATPVPAYGLSLVPLVGAVSPSGAIPTLGAGWAGVGTAGTVSISGATGTLTLGQALQAIAGTVSPSGSTGVLTLGQALTAIAGTVTPIGTPDAVLIAAGPFQGVAIAGTVSPSGQTPVLTLGWAETAIAGTVSVSGATGILGAGWTGVGTAGTVSPSGSTGILALGWAGVGTAGTVSPSGSTGTLTLGQALQAIAGTVSPSGSTGVLALGQALTAIAGTVTPIGTPDAILVAGSGDAFQGVAIVGTVSLAGATPSPAYGLDLTALVGTVAPSGAIPVLALGLDLTATAGTVAISDNTPVLAVGWAQPATAGTVAPLGATPTLAAGWAGIAIPGTVLIDAGQVWWINWTWTALEYSIGQPPRKPDRMIPPNKPGLSRIGLHTFLPLTDSSRERDISGKARNVTLNGTTWETGVIGPVLSFDEVDDYLTVEVGEAFGEEFTLGFWFRVEEVLGSYYQYIVSHGVLGVGENLHVYLVEGASPVLRTALQDVDDTPSFGALDVAADNLIDGRWHLYELRVTLDGSEVYVDGVLSANDATRGGSGYSLVSDVYLGGRTDLEAQRYFGGELGAFWIYNVALPEADLAEHYARPWKELEETLQIIDDVEVDPTDTNILRSVGCCMQRTVWPVPFGGATTEADWKHISYTYRDFLSPPSATLFIPEELGLELLVELN